MFWASEIPVGVMLVLNEMHHIPLYRYKKLTVLIVKALPGLLFQKHVLS